MWDVLDSPYRVVVTKGTANYFSFSGKLALEQYDKVFRQKMIGRDDAAVKDTETARAMMMKDPRVLYFSSSFSFFEDPDVVRIHK